MKKNIMKNEENKARKRVWWWGEQAIKLMLVAVTIQLR
jgi:hypothetical protein